MKQTGFTLIELLAVIVIIAIIATIGMFSVTKIMDSSRINTLNDSALAVRKAAKLYISSQEVIEDVTLNMTPGRGDEDSLIDMEKDPWGNPYELILAEITFADNDYEILVRMLTTKGCYVLEDNNDTAGTGSCPTNISYGGEAPLAGADITLDIAANPNPPYLLYVNSPPVPAIPGQLDYITMPSGASALKLTDPHWLPNQNAWINTAHSLETGSQYQITVSAMAKGTSLDYYMNEGYYLMDEGGGNAGSNCCGAEFTMIPEQWHTFNSTITYTGDGISNVLLGIELAGSHGVGDELYIEWITITKI